ncbi:MAG: sulfur carrier protein ThiS [Chloroflexi bacterium]|nr:sulfur carrier protein ThiS [Chloroflexota bacterium]MBI3742576.1 sulfur carrier protein ThiS [Chloroflexota bacterium]
MQITLKLYGNIKRYAPNQKENASVEITNGMTIRALLDQLGVPDPQVWLSAVNDNVVDDTTVLKAGDVLEVFEPIGGGES